MGLANRLVRPTIAQLKAYSSARSLASVGEVFLDANEWVWSEFARYPNPQPPPLRSALAELYEQPEERVLVSRGSDEAIDCLVRAFCEPHRDSIVICPPTFDIYAHAAHIHAVGVVRVPLAEDDFSLPIAALLAAIRPQTKLIFLCSPNNPTGQCLKVRDLLTVLDATRDRALVVVDEAYIEFSQKPSALAWLNEFENLVVLRTLSKYWSGAALRVGATLAHLEVILQLRKVLAPYPIPEPIIKLALEHLQKGCPPELNELSYEREQLADFFTARKFVHQVYPSDANFLLIKVAEAGLLVEELKRLGIVVRDRSLSIPQCVRVTVGRPHENQRLCETIRLLESEGRLG